MKLLAPIAALIAAASAGQIYAGQSAESYANAAELYQSELEHQQQGLYSDQSHATQEYAGHDSAYNSRPAAEKTARILGYKMENNGHQYQYAYETENGIKAQESGETSEHGTVAHGAYSYTGDDGHTYTVTYTADEHGFHPQGAHLPTPPPIPEEIQKSLEQNARDEASGIYDDGKYTEQSGEGIAHGYQQHEASYQTPATTYSFQAPSGHAAGQSAYHAQSGHGAGQSAYHAQSGHGAGQSAYHAQSGHGAGQSAYHAQSGHGAGAELAYHAQSGHSAGAALGYHGQAGHAGGAELAYHAHSGQTHSGLSLGPELAYRHRH